MIQDAGIIISLERPYIGATPDTITTGDSCGRGVEVKCPYCFKDGLPEEDVKRFYMEKDDTGKYKKIYDGIK